MFSACAYVIYLAGLSSSVETQLKDLLEVVGSALKGVSDRHQEIEKTKELARSLTEQTEARAKQTLERIHQGTYHNGRIDTVSGPGVISELGIGDGKMTDKDTDGGRKAPKSVDKAVLKVQKAVISGKDAVKSDLNSKTQLEPTGDDGAPKSGLASGVVDAVQGGIQGVVKGSKEVVKGSKENAEKLWADAKDQFSLLQDDIDKPRPIHSYQERLDEEIRALPVVVIKNYATKTPFTDLLITVLADWAAGLADGGLAHVVVLSDNRDNGRRLEKGRSNSKFCVGSLKHVSKRYLRNLWCQSPWRMPILRVHSLLFRISLNNSASARLSVKTKSS